MLPWLPSYIKMMPALRARDALLLATAVAIGSGSVRKGTARRIMQEWRRAARVPGERQPVQRPKSREEHFAMLKAMGIQVEG